MSINGVNAWYGNRQVLKEISLDIYRQEILALIGPSGCGKTTLLRCLNRMCDLAPNFRLSGNVTMEGQNIYDGSVDPVVLRRKVGMVFQHPNPFQMTIFENVAFGVKESNPSVSKHELQGIVEKSLRQANLWDEVHDKLHSSGFSLSGGQQQRLCIARVLAVRPEVILLDEPCASLDPISTSKIEALLNELKKDYTVVVVTHNLGQAKRISDRIAFFLHGELVEHGQAADILVNPRVKTTEDYLVGNFG
jgi:phosphate transport system ATP-binding protein